MIRMAVLVAMAVLIVGLTVQGWAAEDDGSKITILTPRNGEVVKGPILQLKYELVKGKQAAHAHTFLDGQYQKGFSGLFKNLTPGKHEIKVIAADQGHQTLAAEAVVTIEVQ
jgi:hypothetical protein